MLVLNLIKQFLISLLLCLSTFLLVRLIVQYFTFDSRVGFLAVKQDYISIPIWRAAFYVHVFSSIFTLMVGATQFSPYIKSHWTAVHRWIGKLYIIDVLLINVPAGFILAIYANGSYPAKSAFLILDILWFWFTLKSYLEIRKRNFVLHKQFMIRSYALTCSAVTLRAWRMILASVFMFNPVTLYMIIAWLGFLPNLIIAEWLIRTKRV